MVTASLVLAAALATRVHPTAPATLLAAFLWPTACLPVLLVATMIAIRSPDLVESESSYLHAVAVELQAGASLRSAVADAAERSPGLDLRRLRRLAAAGAPLSDLADAVAMALPEQGRVAAAALRTAGQTGGRVATVFDSLAQVSTEDRQLRRETRAATAQARISAWIVGGLPAGYLAFQLASGRLPTLVATPIGLGVVVVGVGFIATGSGVVAWMMKRAVA